MLIRNQKQYSKFQNIYQLPVALGILVGIFFSSLGLFCNLLIPLVEKTSKPVLYIFLFLLVTAFITGVTVIMRLSMFLRKQAGGKNYSTNLQALVPFVFGFIGIGIPSWLNLFLHKTLLVFCLGAVTCQEVTPFDLLLGGITIPLFAGIICIEVSKPESMISED